MSSLAKQDRCLRLLDMGYSKREIADQLKIPYMTVRNLTRGHLSTKTRNTRKYHCKTCGLKGARFFYKDQLYECKACWLDTCGRYRELNTIKYIQSRGACACSLCGYDRYATALEFHNPRGRDQSWPRGWTWAQYQQLLDSYLVVCANCHRHLHSQSGE